MGPWGYVFLAYGIVWCALIAYLLSLWRRLRSVESELSRLRAIPTRDR
jgi:CcmD family protein